MLLRHCEPTGPREARPDDTLREAIHFPAYGRMDCFVALLPRNDGYRVVSTSITLTSGHSRFHRAAFAA
jgi:hypothetical protein